MSAKYQHIPEDYYKGLYEPDTKEVTITFEVPKDSHIDELAITTLLKSMGADDICIDINE